MLHGPCGGALNTAEGMMKLLLLHMVEGFRTTADVYSHPRGYSKIVRGGFATDAKRLQGDVRTIGADVKRTLSNIRDQEEDGQSADTRSSTVA